MSVETSKSEQDHRGLWSWLSALPGGLTLIAPVIDKLALDGLITRAIRGFRNLAREFWSLVEIALPFQISEATKDTLTIAALLIFPALFQYMWTKQTAPVATGLLFGNSQGLFHNRSIWRYFAVSASFLLMTLFLIGSDLPILIYFIGVLIVGFSSMVSWRAPIVVVVWACMFLLGAYVEVHVTPFLQEHVVPVVERYFDSIGV